MSIIRHISWQKSFFREGIIRASLVGSVRLRHVTRANGIARGNLWVPLFAYSSWYSTAGIMLSLSLPFGATLLKSLWALQLIMLPCLECLANASVPPSTVCVSKWKHSLVSSWQKQGSPSRHQTLKRARSHPTRQQGPPMHWFHCAIHREPDNTTRARAWRCHKALR